MHAFAGERRAIQQCTIYLKALGRIHSSTSALGSLATWLCLIKNTCTYTFSQLHTCTSVHVDTNVMLYQYLKNSITVMIRFSARGAYLLLAPQGRALIRDSTRSSGPDFPIQTPRTDRSRRKIILQLRTYKHIEVLLSKIEIAVYQPLLIWKVKRAEELKALKFFKRRVFISFSTKSTCSLPFVVCRCLCTMIFTPLR